MVESLITLLDELRVSEHARLSGDHVLGAEAAERALVDARAAGDARASAQARTLLALHLWRQGLSERAAGLGMSALVEVDACGHAEWSIDLRNTLTMAYHELGMEGEALPLAVEALRRARALGRPGLLSLSLNRLHVVYQALGQVERALELVRQAVIESDLDGGSEVRFAARLNLSITLKVLAEQRLQEGRLAEHEASVREALATLPQAEALARENPHQLMSCQGFACTLLLELRDFEALAVALERQQELAARNRLPHYLAFGELRRIEWLLASGQVEAACRALEASGSRLEQTADDADLHALLKLRHQAFKAGGRPELALAAIERLLELERRDSRERMLAQSRVLLREVEVESARSETEQLRQQAVELRTRAAAAADQALLDPLTGLANRRALDASLNASLPGHAGAEPGLCLAMIDVDHFKRINDSQGHGAGDAVLRELGRLLAAATRSHDLVARCGGEEFVVLINGQPLSVATEVCERLRSSVEGYDWSAVLPSGGVTVSIGLTVVASGDDAAGLLQRADAAMYRAKQGGRNRLVVD